MVSQSKDDETASDLIRTVSRHSLAYILCAVSEMFRHYDFDPLDLIIVHAVLNANVLNVMKNPELDRRFGSVQAVERVACVAVAVGLRHFEFIGLVVTTRIASYPIWVWRRSQSVNSNLLAAFFR